MFWELLNEEQESKTEAEKTQKRLRTGYQIGAKVGAAVAMEILAGA